MVGRLSRLPLTSAGPKQQKRNPHTAPTNDPAEPDKDDFQKRDALANEGPLAYACAAQPPAAFSMAVAQDMRDRRSPPRATDTARLALASSQTHLARSPLFDLSGAGRPLLSFSTNPAGEPSSLRPSLPEALIPRYRDELVRACTTRSSKEKKRQPPPGGRGRDDFNLVSIWSRGLRRCERAIGWQRVTKKKARTCDTTAAAASPVSSQPRQICPCLARIAVSTLFV